MIFKVKMTAHISCSEMRWKVILEDILYAVGYLLFDSMVYALCFLVWCRW